MNTNLFDFFEQVRGEEDSPAPWAARAPRRPQPDYDLKLVSRSPQWQQDAQAVDALGEIENAPWSDALIRAEDGIRLRVSDSWIEAAGAALEAGGSAEPSLEDLASGRRFSVQFWDPNATKALHIGHLRNLAIGNALAAALVQAGGRVERRSLISDAGRNMGEAMAGVLNSGRLGDSWPGGEEKSDHFVGACYADYVAGGLLEASALEPAEDSLTRELLVQNDAADDLIKRVLHGDREALELWYRTRAWVISGQRKTLARLGVAFDRVFFESDFLSELAQLSERGLREGTLRRRSDGVVVYDTDVQELAEMPLVRADGLPTQHMRSLTYCMTAPELDDMVSMQVAGSEWVSHVTVIRKLADKLRPEMSRSFHPSLSIFHGMVAQQHRALTSSAGAPLIDDLVQWLDAEIDADPAMREVRSSHPAPERIAAQIALGYFLPYPVTPDLDFEPRKLLSQEESVGWNLVRARARHGNKRIKGRPAEDPDYRFAVVQSALYRRYLRLAVARLDVRPMAHYMKHLSLWYLERERGEHVERVVHTLLDRVAHGLGLEA